MANLQAKTEEQRLHIANILGFAAPIDENGISTLCYVEFDTLAEIVDYLRKDFLIIDLSAKENLDASGKVLQFETTNILCDKIIEYNRLLDENRKLFNECERLKKENEILKEKCKNLPRIATLNKRIHELKEQIKKYKM